MASLDSYSKKIAKLITSKLGWVLIGFVLFFSGIYYLINSYQSDDEIYFIAQEVQWKGAHLYSKEKNFTTFNYELIQEINQEEDIKFKLFNITSEEIEDRLENGEFQGILTSNQPNPLSSYKFVFSNVYFYTGPVLTLSVSSDIKGWGDISKKIIGVHSYSPTVLEVQRQHGIQIKVYNDMNRAFADLDDDKIDGVIYGAIPSYVFVNTFYKDRLKIVSGPLNDDGIRLMALKNSVGEKIVKEFNAGMLNLKENGSYDKLIDRWGLIDATKISKHMSDFTTP